MRDSIIITVDFGRSLSQSKALFNKYLQNAKCQYMDYSFDFVASLSLKEYGVNAVDLFLALGLTEH